MSDTTRRHPRTLAEAFGPYTSTHIEEPRDPPTLGERVLDALYWIVSLALLAALVTAAAWWPDWLHA